LSAKSSTKNRFHFWRRICSDPGKNPRRDRAGNRRAMPARERFAQFIDGDYRNPLTLIFILIKK
jgi:hypothetical protein